MPLQIPNLDYIRGKDQKLADALIAIRDGINSTGQQLGVDASGELPPPHPVQQINASESGGTVYGSITDNSPVFRPINYFVEWDTNPNFPAPRIVHLGPSRTFELAHRRSENPHPNVQRLSRLACQHAYLLSWCHSGKWNGCAEPAAPPAQEQQSGNGGQPGQGFGPTLYRLSNSGKPPKLAKPL